jgi:hypothetical protein
MKVPNLPLGTIAGDLFETVEHGQLRLLLLNPKGHVPKHRTLHPVLQLHNIHLFLHIIEHCKDLLCGYSSVGETVFEEGLASLALR